MFVFLILCAVCIVAADYNEVLDGLSCTTPSKQIGKCRSLRSCPPLLWPFANYKTGNREHLKYFYCAYDYNILYVCCYIPTEYLIFEDDEDGYDPTNIQNVKLINSNDCGISTKLVTSNGIVRLQDFPWLVKIMVVPNELNSYKDRVKDIACTGVLITSRYVLYSAQCDLSIPEDMHIFARIDTYNSNEAACDKKSYSPKCRKSKIFEIDYFIKHAFYDSRTKINDIALLILGQEVQFSEYIRPICLPTYKHSLNVNQIMYTAGWSRSNTLNDISVKISKTSTFASNTDCKKKLLENDCPISVTSYDMCTYTNQDGDNQDIIGYPLMSLNGNQWYIEGFGSQNCYNIKMHTNVQNYLQWIEERMGAERCSTPYSNQTGQCMHIAYCPEMLEVFANPAPKDEKALEEFMCFYEFQSRDDPKYTLKVCCGLSPRFSHPETAEKNLDLEVSNFKYCGLQHRDDYISMDDTISVDEFPWLVIILNATLPEQRDQVCAGTLITSRYVLTSAQCTHTFNAGDNMLVRLGDYNFKSSSDCVKLAQYDLYDCNDKQEYSIEEKIIHPFYNKFTFYNDIALLRLNKTVVFTDYVRPICLPRSEKDLAKPGEILFTTGLGNVNRYYKRPDVKKKIRTTLISNKECQEQFNSLGYITPVTQYQVCTKDFENSTDITCVGDEGGPLMYSKNVQWFIQGITSTYGCGSKEPQNNLNVYKYLKWIKLNIKNQ